MTQGAAWEGVSLQLYIEEAEVRPCLLVILKNSTIFWLLDILSIRGPYGFPNKPEHHHKNKAKKKTHQNQTKPTQQKWPLQLTPLLILSAESK